MRTQSRILTLILALALFTIVAQATGPPDRTTDPRDESPYRLKTSVLSAAGAPGSSSDHNTNGSLGQSTPIGLGAAGDAILHAGFWKALALTTWPVGVDEPAPAVNALYQNYPNPFNPTTEIRFSVEAEGLVRIELFDVGGERVRRLMSERKAPGQHVVVWDGRDDAGQRLASGVYLYRIEQGSFTATRKLVMIK
ncbi:MAG: T9SS type A sorting domain-containing protein [Candidatus Krumholzibacteriota bacterium]|nr:T9SS type A sorting domain-containing protein [Candidatus Krumholzibacteriota bacterium]